MVVQADSQPPVGNPTCGNYSRPATIWTMWNGGAGLALDFTEKGKAKPPVPPSFSSAFRGPDDRGARLPTCITSRLTSTERWVSPGTQGSQRQQARTSQRYQTNSVARETRKEKPFDRPDNSPPRGRQTRPPSSVPRHARAPIWSSR